MLYTNPKIMYSTQEGKAKCEMFAALYIAWISPYE